MKRVVQMLSRVLAVLFMAVIFVPMLFAAPEVSEEIKVQVLGMMAVLLPFVVGLIKKLKIPTWMNPFMPLILGVVTQVALALTGIVDIPIITAVAIGMGVGGVGSSVYDSYKAIKPLWPS